MYIYVYIYIYKQAQQRENRDVESKTDQFSRIVAKKREDLLTGQAKQVEFKDELESLKNELATAAEVKYCE